MSTGLKQVTVLTAYNLSAPGRIKNHGVVVGHDLTECHRLAGRWEWYKRCGGSTDFGYCQAIVTVHAVDPEALKDYEEMQYEPENTN